MVEHALLGIRFFTYEIFDAYRNVTNVVTSRHRGRSRAPFDSFNLALHVGDDPNAVLDNRATAAQLLGFEPEAFTFARQVHGANVAVVRSGDRGRGSVVEDDALPDTDAMITRALDTPLAVLVADCVAVSLFDPEHNAVGVAHAGWAGTRKRIAQKTIAKMTEEFGTRPKAIVAGVGPSIGACHYPVGNDVVEAFENEFGTAESTAFLSKRDDGQMTLDLWGCNRAQLVESGVADDKIEVAGYCTACQEDLFYSHRAGDGQTGRIAAIIMLNSSSPRAY